MALENLISVKFTEEEKKQVIDCLKTLENIFGDKVINLTPEERQSYARIGEKTENWIDKVHMWMRQFPEIVPFYLDMDEFNRDIEFRDALKPFCARLTKLSESLDDTSILLSNDIYHVALAYYRNIKIVSRANVPGSSEIYEDLSTQFPGRPSVVPEEPQESY